MPEKFQLLTKCLGYISKPDESNAPVEALVTDSQNVLINDGEKVQTRKGMTIYGAAGSGTDGVEAAVDWSTSTNSVINIRAYGSTLQAYIGTVDGVAKNAWTNIGEGITFSAVDFSFATWWDTSESIDILLMINGADKIYDWSGGLATIASATTNTITKNGTTTWAENRFLTSGTRKVYIDGTAYTYTGGESTTTLTGVTPDPSGEAANSLAYQAIRTNDNEPVDTWINDFHRVKDNQLWVGSNKRNEVYVSKNTSITDYSFSSPRVPGEGALLVLDSVGRGFMPLTNEMLITAGRDDWYKSSFHELDIGGTLSETLKVKKLKTSPGMAAQSQDLIAGEYFVSFEPCLRRVIGVDDNDNLITEDLSDPIKPDFDAADFTNGHIKVHRNRVYITCPNDSKVFILEKRRNQDGTYTYFWQPPQIMAIQRFAIISDDIYGHSSGINETYQLFEGTDDNGAPISFNASFAYRNYKDRAIKKTLDEVLVEGYISGNCDLKLTVNYDFDGSTDQKESTISGSDSDILFQLTGGGSLGESGLGEEELGDEELGSTDNPKFRVIKTFPPQDFFEVQFVFESSGQDDVWEILAHGANVKASTNQASELKQ